MPERISIALPGPLTEVRFRERPNRFLVHGELADGSLAVAHLADPGRMRELLQPGRRMWLHPAEGQGRKTRWSTVLVESPGGLVSVDTLLPNRLVLAALGKEALPELRPFRLERPEVRVGRSRFDFLLQAPGGRKLYLEVKSVSWVEEGVALFPDAVTSRGARHVRELAALGRQPGVEAAVLFVVQRGDARTVRAAERIDPLFAASLEEARQAGVRALARRVEVSRERIALGEPLQVERLGGA